MSPIVPPSWNVQHCSVRHSKHNWNTEVCTCSKSEYAAKLRPKMISASLCHWPWRKCSGHQRDNREHFCLYRSKSDYFGRHTHRQTEQRNHRQTDPQMPCLKTVPACQLYQHACLQCFEQFHQLQRSLTQVAATTDNTVSHSGELTSVKRWSVYPVIVAKTLTKRWSVYPVIVAKILTKRW